MARRRRPQPSGLIVIEQTTGDIDKRTELFVIVRLVVFRTQTSTCLLWVMTMLSCCTHLTALCRGRHWVVTDSEVAMEWCPHLCGPTPFFSVSRSFFGWRGASCLSRRLLLTGAIRFLHHLPLALFCLYLNRLAKGKMSFFAAFKHISCVSLNHDLFIVSLHKSEWTKKKKRKKNRSYNTCSGLQLPDTWTVLVLEKLFYFCFY